MAMEGITNLQIEFWAQVKNKVPDLNALKELSKKIFASNKNVENLWSEMCRINPNYSKALMLYGNYMIEIRNHNQIGYELISKAKKEISEKSVDESETSLNELFSDSTAIIHISGNKENAGQILKTNQGLCKLFGYSKAEVTGHSINILMPIIFAKRHNEFLEKYFKTGYKIVLDEEQILFGLHRCGFCFCMKMFVKPMPTILEGIQYIGMIRELHDNANYILTDQRGVIDCFSNGINSLLKLPVDIFKEVNINIQIFAPELMKVFSSNEKNKKLLSKFQDSGGEKLTVMIPKEFLNQVQVEARKNTQEKGKASRQRSISGSRKGKVPFYLAVNDSLNKHNGLNCKQSTPQQLIQSHEYKECEVKLDVKCEIKDLTFGEIHKDMQPLIIRVFKIFNDGKKKYSSEIDGKSESLILSSSGILHEHKESKDSILEANKEEVVHSFHTSKNEVRIEAQEPRQDTNITEKLGVNFTTAERCVETGEHFSPIEAQEGKQSPKNRTKNTSKKKVGLISFDKEKIERGDFEMDAEVKNDILTPRMNLGNLRTPEILSIQMVDEFEQSQQNESVDVSESKFSVKHNATEDVKSISDLKVATIINYNNNSKKPFTHLSRLHSESTNTLDKGLSSCSQLQEKFLAINERNINMRYSSKFVDQIKHEEQAKPDSKHSGYSYANEVSKSSLKEFNVESIEQQAKAKEAELKRGEEEKRGEIWKLKNINKYKRIILNNSETELMEIAEYKITEEEIKLRKSLLSSQNKKNVERKRERKEEPNNDGTDNNEEKSEKKEYESQIEDNIDVQSCFTENTTGIAMRSYYSLRSAIGEKYIPNSVRKTNCLTSFVLLVIFGITIALFVVQILLYEKIKGNIENINICQERIQNLINLSADVYNLVIINGDQAQHAENPYLPPEESFYILEGESLQEEIVEIRERIINTGTALKDVQTYISKKTPKISKDALHKINPTKMELKILDEKGDMMPFSYTMWQSIMEAVVSAYRISEMNITLINDTINPTVSFLTMNSVNGILVNLDRGSDAAAEEIYNVKKLVVIVQIAMFTLASVTVLSAIILFVVSRNGINRSKQRVIELFMYIKRQCANNELIRCRKFLSAFQINPETELINEEPQEEDEDDAEPSLDKCQSTNDKFRISKRKFKPLVRDFGVIIFKFVFLTITMECYFVLSFALSVTFLNKVASLASELNSLMFQYPENSLLLLAQQ